jgi:hypothetical protein
MRANCRASRPPHRFAGRGLRSRAFKRPPSRITDLDVYSCRRATGTFRAVAKPSVMRPAIKARSNPSANTSKSSVTPSGMVASSINARSRVGSTGCFLRDAICDSHRS